MLTGQVVRGVERVPLWRATLNQTDLGTWPDEESAKARVEDTLRSHMEGALIDWALYNAHLKKKPVVPISI